MNLPAEGTRNRAVMNFLFKNGDTTVDGIRIALEPMMNRALVTKAIGNLQDKSCIENQNGSEARLRTNDVVSLTPAARYEMEDEMEAVAVKTAGVLVQPRQVNVLTAPPLSKSLYMNVKGTRPDSDWSQYASLHAPMSKPV